MSVLTKFMLPTPTHIDKRTVRASLAKIGLDSTLVNVCGDLGKIFIKPHVYLRRGEYKLFKDFIDRLGGRYRKDYGVWVIRVQPRRLSE